METKKDIYNLWIQYTTKNEEEYFRQFVSGFVKIWKIQLKLDTDICPDWNEIKRDSGPHLSRLPDELLPAIGKFLIIAKDEAEKEQLTSDQIEKINTLIDCLVIICRHFDNINVIIKYDYISNLIAVLSNIFISKSQNKDYELENKEKIFERFYHLMEAIYDPYLTWRNFLIGKYAKYEDLSYKPGNINVEIIPFIYDCFQSDKIIEESNIATNLINSLGCIIAGSQKSLTSMQCMSTNSGERINVFNCDNLKNGMRAVCPATVSIVINLVSKWECYQELRNVNLKCCALMVIVLQRSSPEERQIDLVTVLQQYSDSILALLKTNHFSKISNSETFEISNDNENYAIDVNALHKTVENICEFINEKETCYYICNALLETNLIDVIITVITTVKEWNIDHQSFFSSIINAFSAIIHLSNKAVTVIKSKIKSIFSGIRNSGKPSEKLLDACIKFAYNEKIELILVAEILTELIVWLPEINEREQIYISNLISKVCCTNNNCISIACEQKLIKVICCCLSEHSLLSPQCVTILIKLIEELSKHSITPIEMKHILWLLRNETEFPQAKQIFQTLAFVALNSINIGNICSEFLSIQEAEDGIIIPNIKNWTMPGSYGFIFHVLVKLNKIVDNLTTDTKNKTYRRMLFTLMTRYDTGFEVFIQSNGTLVIAAITKREYLTSSVVSKTLLDDRWHFVTVVLTPPKRPFSYSQINVYIDFLQKLSATLKVQSFNDPFTYCTIGSAFQASKKPHISCDVVKQSTSQETTTKGMFPSIFEKTFLPQIASHVPNYFTLPLRNATSFDPNVKNFPIGMQNTVFGEQICLKGLVGAVVLAEPSTSLKTIFDGGVNFPSIFSQDNETIELTSRLVFCYSAAAFHNGICADLSNNAKFNASVFAQHCKTSSPQDIINSVGGILSLLPILENIVKQPEEFFLVAENKEEVGSDDAPRTPSLEEFSDWEMLSYNFYAEWKMIQQPLACFLCLLRYLLHDHPKNQENLISNDSFQIIGSILSKCNSKLFDVNALMAIHLLIESIQNQKPTNSELLGILYKEIVFNFDIWGKMQFQITLGHIQYLTTMIKDDRKYFRKRFGIQFLLDVIRQYYFTPDSINLDDAKTMRLSLLAIVRYYIQKEVNINEIGILITFFASIKHDCVNIEMFEMLISHLESKSSKDQIFLLLHEQQTADLLYNFFVEKFYSTDVQKLVLKLLNILITTPRVQQKYKNALRLQDNSVECGSLYPGFLSHLLPLDLNLDLATSIIDQFLLTDADYCGLLFFVHHIKPSNVALKLEAAKRLLSQTFTKTNSPEILAKQVGWQESISRLLIRKSIENINTEERKLSLGLNVNDILLEDNTDYLTQSDLISFTENNIEIKTENDSKDASVILNEIQASVTEAATVIEHEIKELAESVSGAVAENIANVYSVIRQTTSEIQDTFESFTNPGSFENDTVSYRNRTSSNSSDDLSSGHSTNTLKKSSKDEPSVFDFAQDIEVDSEEQLTYLVTNILFTILWRGVSNDSICCWKERGQVLACINLLGLNNELIASHLTLRLRLLEMAVQASLFDLSEAKSQILKHQENAAQVLRMVYDLIVLDPNEDDSKKCSTKLLDGVFALLDSLMIFQQSVTDDWTDMTRLCFGILLKCLNNQNPDIVAMVTGKLHIILQNRNTAVPTEFAYILFSVNKELAIAIEVGNPEQYSLLMPIIKVLLEKYRTFSNLEIHLPGLPNTNSGPQFLEDFQMYSTSKKWKIFIEKKIKPLYDSYQNEVSSSLWEPLNTFWAECYEACKVASQKRVSLQMESRRRFQQKIIIPWKVRQVEEMSRLNSNSIHRKTKEKLVEMKWKSSKRFLYGPRGPWHQSEPEEEYWKLSNHENTSRMRLKLEPQLYPDKHENAANLRDNATTQTEFKRQLSAEFNSKIKSAVVRDFLSDDENSWLEEEIRITAEPQHQDISLEKAVISQECELVTLMTRVKGRIEVNQTVFTFIDLSPERKDVKKHDFWFPIAKIREVHLRKYNLRRSALEIFLIDQTSYFINFTTKTRNKIFSKILSLQPPNILYGSGRSPSELLKASGLTQKWMHREISNFEYLMYLNTIAGRSYNDLSQYPVFPWILANYTSSVLDLTDPKSFRDLTKPVGVINPKNEAEVRAKYENFEDPSGAIPKFHYGTHYSNSAGVLHYLIRVEPFTSLHIDLQSGRFDVADRQFHSIPQTWKLLMDNPNDVKELIPEFFYFPEFLKNMNKFDLGQLQITKEKVDDVILPTWANTPEEFIAIHRRALESEYVSQNLHNWIDLIFGYKQKGPKAVEALNVFYYCSYEGAVDLDKISNPVERAAVEGMINNFGQTPSQLLRDAHPRRLTLDETIMKLLKLELRRPDFTQFLDRIIPIHCEFSPQKDPVIFLSVPRSPPKSFLQLSPDVLVSVSKSSILGGHSWISFDKEKGFLLELDATITNTKNRKKISGPFHPSLEINSQIFAVSLDGKYLYSGGIWDNSLRVFSVHKGKIVASVTRHLGIITCLALDNCGSYLVTGSKDCTSIIWHISSSTNTLTTISSSSSSGPQVNTNNSITPKPFMTLYGHDDSISSVAIYTELNMVVSGSLDGTVNVYTIEEGQFVRTLKPLGCTEHCAQITFISLSYQGHIAFSALDDASHSVHVYSVNGTSLGSKYVSGRVTGLRAVSDFLLVTDDAGDITLSRLNGLKPVYDIPLHIPIQTVVVTPGNTHILAPLRDGRLAVIAVSLPTSGRKHSILNV